MRGRRRAGHRRTRCRRRGRRRAGCRCRTSSSTRGDVAVESCTRTAAADWYFASGTTVEGSQQYLRAVQPVRRRRHRRRRRSSPTPASRSRRPCRRSSCRAGPRITIPVHDSVLRQCARRRPRPRADRAHRRRADRRPSTTPRRTATTLHRHRPLGRCDLAGDGVACRRRLHERRRPTCRSRSPTSPPTDARVDVTTIVTDGKKLAPQTVRVPSHGVVNVDVSQRVALDRDSR